MSSHGMHKVRQGFVAMKLYQPLLHHGYPYAMKQAWKRFIGEATYVAPIGRQGACPPPEAAWTILRKIGKNNYSLVAVSPPRGMYLFLIFWSQIIKFKFRFLNIYIYIKEKVTLVFLDGGRRGCGNVRAGLLDGPVLPLLVWAGSIWPRINSGPKYNGPNNARKTEVQ